MQCKGGGKHDGLRETGSRKRRVFERTYDRREGIVPAQRAHAASAEEADAFFTLKIFQVWGC